ncbi:MAG: aminotransferase class V-fold PLP-dependent enzyme [Kofleriaceae bacterium]
MTNSIYLDNAASTPVDPAVIARLTEVLGGAWGNPSAAHPHGVAARRELTTARAQLLAALEDGGLGELVWTSGCTEADALALFGAAATGEGDVVLSTIEHPAVAENARRLERAGRVVRWVRPRPDGRLEPRDVAAQAAGARVLSFIAVQNEVGAIQPFAEIAAAVKEVAPRCHVHLDAAQALGKVPLSCRALSVDSIALAAHKLHGPPGIGALWLRRGAALEPLWSGGGQQGGLRSGTQNASGAAAFGLAAELAVQRLEEATARWRAYAAQVRATLEAAGAPPVWHLAEDVRAPHILALGFRRVSAEAVRNTLASRGISVSTGSACATSGGHRSALAELGVGDDVAMVRLSFGHQTTPEEVERAARGLAAVVRELAGEPG